MNGTTINAMKDVLLDTTPIPETLEQLQQVAQDQQYVKYIVVAAFVVMLYDNLLTLSEEASINLCIPENVWHSNGFFSSHCSGDLERQEAPYSSSSPGGPYSSRAFFMSFILWISTVPNSCKMEAYLTAWGALVFLIPLQIVIVLRTIALWERSRVIIVVLLTAAMATDIALLVMLIQLSISLHFTVDPLFAPFLGCESGLISFNPRSTIPCYICIIAFDTTIFSLTLFRALRTIRRTHLVTILVRDGFVYYSVMLAIGVSAVTVSSTLPFERSSLIAIFAPIIKASFCIVGSRIALNLREAMRFTDERNGRSEGCDLDD